MTISNYHNACPLSCIMYTLQSQNAFLIETTYTKVHFYVQRPKSIVANLLKKLSVTLALSSPSPEGLENF